MREVTLEEIFADFFSNIKALAGCGVLAVVIAIAVFKLTTPKYEVQAILKPNQQNQQGGLASLAGQFGGVASLAGVDLGGMGQKTDYSVIAKELVTRPQFIMHFLNKFDYGAFFDSSGEDDKAKVREIVDTFKDYVNMTVLSESGLVELSVKLPSPKRAKLVADSLIREINDYFRDVKSEEIGRNLDFLKKEVKKSRSAEMQAVLYSLIEEQTKQLMLASSNPDFVYSKITSIYVPEEPTEPKPVVILVVSILGVFFSYLMAVILICLSGKKNK